MQSPWKLKGKKLHTRTIEVSTYEYAPERIILEGSLKDEHLEEAYSTTGGKYPSGVIHHMSIQLLVNSSNFMIEDIAADLLTVPHEPCWETAQCLAPIKGLTVTKGFTAKVKKLVGGKTGCTHLVELILAMAPAVFQGIAAYRAPKSPGIYPAGARMTLKHLVNSCHAWREDSPYVESIRKILDIK